MMVDWWGATAFAAWLADRLGQPWRLPSELEWEKVARGVDGRFFPWGDTLDPSWCCMRQSHARRPCIRAVDSFPIDESVYGVRGLAGNVHEWCADVFHAQGPPCPQDRVRIAGDAAGDTAGDLRVIRGGSWAYRAVGARSSYRAGSDPRFRSYHLGFRVARSAG